MSDLPEPVLAAASALVTRFREMLDDPGFRRDLRDLAEAILGSIPAEPPSQRSPADEKSTGEAPRDGSSGHAAETPSGSAAAGFETRGLAVGRAGRRVEQTGPVFRKLVSVEDAVPHLMPRYNRLAESEPNPPAGTAGLQDPLGNDGANRTSVSLVLVQKRCRIKADAARWAAERRRRIAAGADFGSEIEPHDREIIARAKQVENCYLWTNNPRGPEPGDVSDFDRLATCFDIVAEAIECVRTAVENDSVDSDLRYEALQLLAESQSLLRVNVLSIGFAMDSDQNEVFRWLRDFSAGENVYIERFMRINDVPQIDETGDLRQRVSAMDRKLGERVVQGRQHRRLLGKIRWESRMVQEHPLQQENRLRTVSLAVEKLVQSGLPPSSVELRDCVLPIADQFETLSELPSEMVQVLRAVDTFRNRHPAPVSVPARPVEWSEEVMETRRRLEGRAVFLIGGELRPVRKAAIEEAFGLSELIWETTVEHSTLDVFRPWIERPEVVLVLLAIRWSSHSYSEIEEVCRRFGKPLVRLPGGMHPNQIAWQVMQQASCRL